MPVAMRWHRSDALRCTVDEASARRRIEGGASRRVRMGQSVRRDHPSSPWSFSRREAAVYGRLIVAIAIMAYAGWELAHYIVNLLFGPVLPR